MRVTDSDYKNIIDYCQGDRLVRDVADKYNFDMPFITQLLGRMVKQGFLSVEQVPYNGQYKNKYKSLPQAYELLEERKNKKERAVIERIKKNKEAARVRAITKSERRDMQKAILRVMTDKFIKPEILAEKFNKSVLQIGRILTGMQSAGLIERHIVLNSKDRERVVYRKKQKEKGLRTVSFKSREMQDKLKDLDELYKGDRLTAISRQKYSVAGSTLNGA